MFQLFLRARTEKFLRQRAEKRLLRQASEHFEAPTERSPDTDQSRLSAVAQAIEQAIASAEMEKDSLSRQIQGVQERASLAASNASDEPEGEKIGMVDLNVYDSEISRVQRRIEELKLSIGHFRFLRAALITRFSTFRARDDEI